MDYSKLVEQLERMGGRTTRYDYSVGHYWNVVLEASEAIRELVQQLNDYVDAENTASAALARVPYCGQHMMFDPSCPACCAYLEAARVEADRMEVERRKRLGLSENFTL